MKGVALDWLRNYIYICKQRVKIGSEFSEFKTIEIGVPQESVLGSLLFLVYINDLPAVSNVLRSVLFADDTCLSLSDTDYAMLIGNFNNELIKIDNWLMPIGWL